MRMLLWEVGVPGKEGLKPPAVLSGQGAMRSLGEEEEGKGVRGLHESKERCFAIKRTIGDVRKSSSVHCSQRSRSVV